MRFDEKGLEIGKTLMLLPGPCCNRWMDGAAGLIAIRSGTGCFDCIYGVLENSVGER